MGGKLRIKRRRLVAACAAVLVIGALLTIFWRQNAQRRMLIREIKESGGGYLTARRGPSWLSANPITMQLGTDDDLRYLFLASTEINDAWLAKLEGRESIEQILLQDTDVTDAGLMHLSSLKNLERLRLDNTAITDDGLKHLQNLKCLKKLYLKGTSVTDTGVEWLQSVLPKCQVIH